MTQASPSAPKFMTCRAARKQRAQTLVFFALALTAIVLLCGLAIDSGLLYLAKARISRAVDGAALAAVGNFHQSDVPATNRALVAETIRNFAAANYTDLQTISATATETPVNATTFSYNFYDPASPAQDANGAYRKFVQVILTIGAGGQIVSASANARCPVHTYFIGIFSHFVDLKVSSSAVATRNPRMIMVVVDRSGSMLVPPSGGGNPGCVGLPAAVVTFLNFFDTSADYIGMVSFGSNARLEMPLTTNFLYAATNDLYEAYDIVTNTYSYGSQSWYVPGPDPEANQANYYTQGVRRFRFGGQTAADEGIRLAIEQMMANSAWANPDVVKYMVIFTDGAWNTTRTMVAAPGYTNIVTGPTLLESLVGTNSAVPSASGTLTNAIYAFLQVPALRPWGDYWSSLGTNQYEASDHDQDILQSLATNTADATYDGNSYLSTPLAGAPHTYTTNTYLTTYDLIPEYTTNLNVWLPPGAVDYVYRAPSSSPHTSETTVSEINNPQKTVNVTLGLGDSNVLVVPGYVMDGIIYDGLDLGYSVYQPYNPTLVPPTVTTRGDNFVTPWMWPDADTPTVTGASDVGTGHDALPSPDTDLTENADNPKWRFFSHSGVFATDAENMGNLGTPNGGTGSFERSLMFRNYMNLLTGYYVFRPDDPLGTGIEPLTGANRPLNYSGAYYPSAAFYWPFDLVGLDQYPTFSLTNNKNPDPSPNGMSRAIAYSINMLSTNAAPEWSGELFYRGTNAALSSTTSQSAQMASKTDWQRGIPSWITGAFDHEGVTTKTESAHNTTNIPSAVVWRPLAFNGSGYSGNNIGTSATACSPSDGNNFTGGYVMDGSGNIWRNAMAWSGRPTHYYDFSRSTWTPIGTNHVKNQQFLPLGNWKASEYCWHARAAGVTIYTIGYDPSGLVVTPAEQAFLATLANATNTTAGGGGGYTNFLPANYNVQQPIGQQFYATNAAEIGTDFSNVATAINAALTQ